MIIKLNLTEDHLKLISHINFQKFKFPISDENPHSHWGWGVDQYNLFGGSFLMEEIAWIIGRQDEYIKGSEDYYMGRQFPSALADYMYELYQFIWDNIEYIEHLLHFYVREGLKVGTYKCVDYERIWEYIPNKE